MEKLNKISINNHIELENIKELLDNITLNSNHVIINEIIKLIPSLKQNIYNLDISQKQKEYYINIIDNSNDININTFNNIYDNISSVDNNESNDEFNYIYDNNESDNEFNNLIFNNKVQENNSLLNKSIESKLSDPKLIKKIFPEYKLLNTKKYNSHFLKLTNKILFY